MWDYTDKVKNHFMNPQNVGTIENADGIGEVGSLACGDALKLSFKLDNNGRIEDAKFQTFGCASAIASSSALTEMLKGKTLEEAEKITNKDIVNYLGGLPKEKIHCSVMGEDALKKAIRCYKNEEPENNEVLCKCFDVTNKKVDEAIRKNNLSTIEEVTDFLKAGGSCKSCHDEIQKLIDSSDSSNISSTVAKSGLTNIQKIKLIDSVLEKEIKPALMRDGGSIELIDVEGNNVFIKLKGACVSCSKSQITLKHYVETKLRELVSPDLSVKEAL